MSLPRLGKMQVIVIGIVLAALGFLIWVYFFWLVWEEQEINNGPSKAASKNRYFAAQKFLENTGLDTDLSYSATAFEAMRISDNKIGERDTIVLSHGRGVINGQRFLNLWSWVESGGTLVLSTESPYFGASHQEDELFSKLGISTYRWDEEYDSNYDEDAEGEEANYSEDMQIEGAQDVQAEIETKEDSPSSQNINYLALQQSHCKNHTPTEIVFDDEPRPLQIFYGREDYFNVDGMSPSVTAMRDSAHVFSRFEVGAGMIWVNASNSIWHNRKIACNDHAYFLSKIVAQSPKAWFVVNKEMPSLFNLVWKGIPIAVIACLLALIFSLWRALLRFGPIFPDKKIERRSFAEHIKAGADFLWRNSLQADLITQLRSDITIRMNRRNVGFEKMSEAEKFYCLRRHLEGDVGELQKVFFGPLDDSTRRDFVFIVSKLKTMKEQL